MKRNFEEIEITHEDWLHIYGRYKSCGTDHEAGDFVMLPKNALAQVFDWIKDILNRSGVFYGTVTSICLIGVAVYGKLFYELAPWAWDSGDVVFVAAIALAFIYLAALFALAARFAYWWISESIVPWAQRKAYEAKNRT